MQYSSLFIIYVLVQLHLMIATAVEVQMPEKCAHKNFCYSRLQPSEYPEKKFRQLLNTIRLQSVEEPDTRQGPDVQNLASEVCSVKETTRLIYYIVDHNNKVRWVAHINDTFTQRYLIAECREPGRVCEERPPFFTQDKLEEFNVQCVNKMVDIKFVVLSEDGMSLELVGVKGGIPMGCYCTYEYLSDELYEDSCYS